MGANRKGFVKFRLPEEESISALEPMGKVMFLGQCPTGKFAQMGISFGKSSSTRGHISS